MGGSPLLKARRIFKMMNLAEIFGYLLGSFFDGVVHVQASTKWVNSEWRGRSEQGDSKNRLFFPLFKTFTEHLLIPSSENVQMKG